MSRSGEAAAGGRRATLGDAAYRVIKEEIITCVLPPGARVTVSELGHRYQLGHTPIRIGLQRLQVEALVRAEARHGWRVEPIRPKDVRESSAVRLLLEPEAAKLAAGNIPAWAAIRLRELCEVEYDPSDPHSLTAYLHSNTELHTLVARASGNDRLADILASLLHADERLFHFGFRLANYGEAVAHQHHDLVEALLAGDGARASAIARQQITDSRRVMMSGLISAVSALDSLSYPTESTAEMAFTYNGAHISGRPPLAVLATGED